MGLLLSGDILNYGEGRKNMDKIKQLGLEQFMHNWKTKMHLCVESFVWGDEVEGMLVKFDDENQKVLLVPKGNEFVGKLIELDGIIPGKYIPWKQEYASYMIESTPDSPYADCLDALVEVEPNMIKRNDKISKLVMGDGARYITMCTYPRLGTPSFLDGGFLPRPEDGASRSLFVPDESITPHVRFTSMTEFIRERRGKKAVSVLPIVKDVNTPSPFIEKIHVYNSSKYDPNKLVPITELEPEAVPDGVVADAMVFGMGACCLQATFQACGMRQCRILYDQLVPMAPLMLALTAGSPAFRGYLVQTDTRWKVITDTADDRSPDERKVASAQEPNGNAIDSCAHNGVSTHVTKSRYGPVSYYISAGTNPSSDCLIKAMKRPAETCGGRYYCYDFFQKSYNDVPHNIDPEVYELLKSENLDEGMCTHYAHIFTRDPLVVYDVDFKEKSKFGSNEFESIQSVNWQSLRFKPPAVHPSDDTIPIGWRVEFRSMEVQLTPKENAYFVLFTNLLARSIIFFNLNFYVPISATETNFERAQAVDAVLKEKFLFRKYINFPPTNTDPVFYKKYFGDDNKVHAADMAPNISSDVIEISLHEIFNGCPAHNFPGITAVLRKYLEIEKDLKKLKDSTFEYLNKVIDFVSARASGDIMTNAKWIRQFITTHPDYKHDSVVSSKINYDLIKEICSMNPYSS